MFGVKMGCVYVWACAILSSVACLAVQYLSTLSGKRRDLKKKTSYRTKCVF
jgi:hypothetical protein